jgi:List-Bact-rpt repeat protein
MLFRTVILAAVALAVIASPGSHAAGGDPMPLNVSLPSIDGWIHVAGEGARWRCHNTCQVKYPRGSTVTLTVENGPGSTFSSWDGACASYGSQPTCTVTMAGGVTGDEVYVRARYWMRLWLPAFGDGYIRADPANFAARSCGRECVDLVDGDYVTLTPVRTNGSTFTGWGGACDDSRSGTCSFTVQRSRVISATFEHLESQANLPPGTIEQPVKPSLEFKVEISGKGTVHAGRMQDFPPTACQGSCTIRRAKGNWVELEALNTGGATFRGWSGWCKGTGTCRFKNERYRSQAPWVRANFS